MDLLGLELHQYKHYEDLNNIESPVIYKKVQNDKRMRARLLISGYKYFGKLSACGEDTNLTLGNILRSRSVKSIRKFEFDP